MRLEHENLTEFKKKISAILSKYLRLKDYQVFFFGSRVTGRGSEYSDIDVGLLGQDEIPLGVLGLIREDMEDMAVLYKVDVVDFYSVSDKFKRVAMEKTEKISV